MKAAPVNRDQIKTVTGADSELSSHVVVVQPLHEQSAAGEWRSTKQSFAVPTGGGASLHVVPRNGPHAVTPSNTLKRSVIIYRRTIMRSSRSALDSFFSRPPPIITTDATEAHSTFHRIFVSMASPSTVTFTLPFTSTAI